MNKKFVKPFPYKTSTKKVTFGVGSPDSTTVYFKGENRNPIFVKGADTLFKYIDFESVNFKNDKGNILNAWYLRSNIVKANNINLVHLRGAAGGLMINQFQAIEPLLAQGFGILVLDYAGYGFSEGNSNRKSILADGEAAISYMNNRADRKTNKLVVYGQSFGGNLAVPVSVKKQSSIDALVTEGAFSSNKDMAAHSAGLGGRIFVKEIYSARRSISKFKKPYLLIHSVEDDVVPFSMGKKIFNKAKSPKTFFEITGKHLQGPALYGAEIGKKIKELVF